MTARGRWVFVALFAAYACIAIPLGVRKGDDVTTEIAQAHRLLDGLILYNTPQTQGIWWPPFTLLLVAPFAALADLSLPLAKACWGALGMIALAWAVHRTGTRRGWRPALLACAVVLFPVHNNFHHLNFETLLVALLVAAADDLAAGRQGRAGVWIGLATALKIFPGLLLPYLALRRQWRALGAAIGTGAAVSVLPLLRYGVAGAIDGARNFTLLTLQGQNFQGGSVVGLHMQKLGRLGYALGGAPASIIALHLLALGLLAAILAARPAEDDPPLEVGSVTLVAVLLTPIAWLHTFTLGYLAWVAAFAYVPPEGVGPRRAWSWCLIAAAVYASTALTALHLPEWLGFVTFHDDTLGALVALALLVWLRIARVRQAAPPNARSPLPV